MNIWKDYASLLDVPFPDILDAYDDVIGSDMTQMRAAAMWDRYYLLIHMFGRLDMLHPWIYARVREVERDPDGYLDLWGREHYKSSVITYGGVIQEVLKDSELTVGIFSHTKAIAKGFLRQIQIEFDNNAKLQTLFPDILYRNPSKEAPMWSLDAGLVVKRKTNPKEATISAHGLVDGMPTGAHFGLMVYDDVVTRESVATPEQVSKTTEMWELSDNLGTVDGRKWHVGTRYSYADTYSEIMKRGAVKVRMHPATEDGTITGKPVLFPQEVWDRKVRDQGEATISTQMLQNPLAGQQRMFNIEDLQVYEVRPATLAVYIMCDPARSKKTDSDNTAIVTLGIDAANNKYLLDGWNHKMDLMERWKRVSNMYVKWKNQTPGIQSVYVGYESFGAQADLDYFNEQMKVTGVRFDIIECAWPREGPGSKIDRVQRLGPDFRSGKFFLPYPTDEKKLTANQLKMMPGYGYRISKPMIRFDGENNKYDMVDQFRMQVHYFPFGGKKDLVDAASRVYDMEPHRPTYNEPNYAEPDYV